jgi:hypothetical protein
MKKQYVAEVGHFLFVAKIYNEHGYGLNFALYPFRNVIGISSKAGKGHVIFGDYEKRLNSKRIVDAMRKNGVSFLCFMQSSPGKYHFFGTQIFSWLDALRISQDIGAEKNYLSVSSVRREFILRVSKKGHKGEPVPMKIFYLKKRNSKDKLSFAHVKFLKTFYGIKPEYFEGEQVATKLACEKYRTTNL